VRDRDGLLADLGGERSGLLMRETQEFLEPAELVDYLEARGMHGVAAKIPQEIRVLLEHDHLDPGAREQQAQHHAGGPAARDRALRDQRCALSHPSRISLKISARSTFGKCRALAISS